MTPASVGQFAPSFDLECTRPHGREAKHARLQDYDGGWLIVVFYPRDFSLVCPTELTALSEKYEVFREHGAEILGISTDTVASHERWISLSKARGGVGELSFPLASDPEGMVSKAFGVFNERQQVASRGLFIIDPNGLIQYQVVHNLSVGRRADEILRVLAAIQTGGLCGEGWTEETPTVIDPTEILGPGRVISHYRIEEVLGSGSFSTVYRAHDLHLERDVALKIFKSGDASRNKQALHEARIAASLNHINVGTIFAVEDAEGASMIAMEYVKGQTLASHIANGPLDSDRAGRITRQVASGMAAAHARGIVHGDLKPANIMVTHDGLAKILDFGLSKRKTLASAVDIDATFDLSDLERSGISGTPSYLSPEQAQGESATTLSDVFSFGAIVYELLAGRKAFPGNNLLQVLNQIARVNPDKLASEVAEPFDCLIRSTLTIDPEDRGLCMTGIINLFPGYESPLEVAEV
jgi:alkyl hydroperoxide reductase subunit AhpC/predicted Ser/Thr protein kinase